MRTATKTSTAITARVVMTAVQAPVVPITVGVPRTAVSSVEFESADSSLSEAPFPPAAPVDGPEEAPPDDTAAPV